MKMKKKIVIILVAVLVILSISYNVFKIGVTMCLAPIEDINISWDESWPPHYVLRFVSGESSSCVKYAWCHITRLGNVINVVVLNTRRSGACLFRYNYVEHTIPLGICFIPGVTHAVVVNGVTETFVAWK